MANYKIRLNQAHKDGSPLDTLYPETKSSCVIADLSETSVNPYNDNEVLTKKNNLDVKLGIVNKYLTNLKKYTFNDLGTDVTSDSSEVKPASMKALSLVNDSVETNATNISGITNFIGKDVAESNGGRAVVLNSLGNAFEFKKMSDLTVGNATVSTTAGTANYAKDAATGSVLAKTLSDTNTTLTRVNTEQQSKVQDFDVSVSGTSLVFKQLRASSDPNNSFHNYSSSKVDITSAVIEAMNGLVYDIPDITIGTCGCTGLAYFGDAYGPGHYAPTSIDPKTDLASHDKAATKALRKLERGFAGWLCTITFKCDIQPSYYEDSSTKPLSHIFILLAKHNITNSSYTAYGVDGAPVATSMQADTDCTLVATQHYTTGVTLSSIPDAAFNKINSGIPFIIKATFTIPTEYNTGGYLLIGASGINKRDTVNFEDIKITLTR